MPASPAPVATGAQQTASITADLHTPHPLSIAALYERYRAGEMPARIFDEIKAGISSLNDPGLFIRGPVRAARDDARARLGSCTSFVNLLDMCAIMVPEALRPRLLRVEEGWPAHMAARKGATSHA